MLPATATLIGFLCLGLAASYSLLNVLAVLVWRLARAPLAATSLAPVTVLKPLCGEEPGLYDDLRSFCLQDYPMFQIIFGLRDPADPARAVAERLAAEFPSVPIDIVVNPQLHGSNFKISNLMNMLPLARHDLLAMADSDGSVKSDYLRSVTAPLCDPRVGLVTCLYHDAPTPGIWSRLGAMYINEWYVPSVLLAWIFGHQGYVSGQTICIRKETLRAIGGLAEIANHLADDYRLGELVRGLGQRIVLSPYVVTGEHHEPSLTSVIDHELRWMRTLSVLRPRGFRGLFLTFSVPLAIAGLLVMPSSAASSRVALALVMVAILSRLTLHVLHRFNRSGRLLADVWLIPLRDVLLLWVWMRSFSSARIIWRGNEFEVAPDGIMRRLS